MSATTMSARALLTVGIGLVCVVGWLGPVLKLTEDPAQLMRPMAEAAEQFTHQTAEAPAQSMHSMVEASAQSTNQQAAVPAGSMHPMAEASAQSTGHSSLVPPPAPESLANQRTCVRMCGDRCGSTWSSTWPAPLCDKPCHHEPTNQDSHTNCPIDAGNHTKRNIQTIALIKWAAQRARQRSGQQAACENLIRQSTPWMRVDEFELFVKTLAQLEPQTYLEWGSGMSTMLFPLLASGQVSVIDNYPPWCEKVLASPVVRCIHQEQQRLNMTCVAPVHPDGSQVQLAAFGMPRHPRDAEVLGDQYVNAVDSFQAKHFDAALVDGRYRVACALKLLNYLSPESVLFIHDFWNRPPYHKVFDYYDLVGTARTMVVLKKKSNERLPQGWDSAYRSFIHVPG